MERRTRPTSPPWRAQGQLHEDAIIPPVPNISGRAHEIKQIPGPAGHGHRRQQTQAAQQLDGQAPSRISVGRRNANQRDASTSTTIGNTTCHNSPAPV